MILSLSLSGWLKMLAKKYHNLEEKMQLLRRCSIFSSWAPQSWHLEGPSMPLFLILSQVRIFLWWTNHIKSLIFVQLFLLHSFCQILTKPWGSRPRRISFASLILKLSSLLLPYLSWSYPSVTRIILWFINLFRVSSLLLRVLSSLQSSFFHVLHLPVLWALSQKYFTFTKPWLSVPCLRPKNSSFKRIGSCFHLSSQNSAWSPSLISQKLFFWTTSLFSQALFHMGEPFIFLDILISSE